jgi:hypothetical protein
VRKEERNRKIEKIREEREGEREEERGEGVHTDEYIGCTGADDRIQDVTCGREYMPGNR